MIGIACIIAATLLGLAALEAAERFGGAATIRAQADRRRAKAQLIMARANADWIDACIDDWDGDVDPTPPTPPTVH